MKRVKHRLSHYRLLSADMGQLIPVGCVEVLPGDSFQHATSLLMRLSPQIAPVMHPVNVRVHHWFVPNRIIWSGWEDFITGGPDGLGSSEQYPTLTSGAKNSLTDYLGVPPDGGGFEVSALPVRAFNLIFNEWYRDQDLVTTRLEDDITVPLIAWEKDYFSAARPWTQKGPEVTLPLGGLAPVTGLGTTADGRAGPTGPIKETGQTRSYSDNVSTGLGDEFLMEMDGIGSSANPLVFADLSDATAASVNDVRKSFALMRYQEARARYGSRYTEYLAYLGIRASDQRLQRPEYIGGGRQTVSFSEILQTAPDTTENSVVGELKGHGIAALRSRRYRRFFEEHGHVISLMSVRPKTMYQDGLDKKWNRRTKEDYFQKELEAIGQQEVIQKEIYADGTAQDETVFGYVDRYREYREERSQVSGEFRDLLDYWHMSRKFGSAPALNEAFINCDATKRIFAEQTQQSLWCMVNHSLQARRMVNATAHARIE